MSFLMRFRSIAVNNKFLQVYNMKTLKIILLSLLCSLTVCGQQLPDPMVPRRLVNDFTGLLNEQQQINLNNKLLKFNNETSTQIYVVTFDDLQGFDIADFGFRLGEKWGIGQKGKDNGLLVLVSPANQKVTIQTGYGLEGAVPDALCRRVIETIIAPGFRAGNYYTSLDSATNVLISLTRGEFTAADYMKGNNQNVPAIIFALIILFLFVFMNIARTRRRFYSPGHSLPWWMLMGAAGSRGSGWGNFSSGSGSFGGGGGGFGGFGGGGGGSFGGGGASGGW
jgi:uncharacterized protein